MFHQVTVRWETKIITKKIKINPRFVSLKFYQVTVRRKTKISTR